MVLGTTRASRLCAQIAQLWEQDELVWPVPSSSIQSTPLHSEMQPETAEKLLQVHAALSSVWGLASAASGFPAIKVDKIYLAINVSDYNFGEIWTPFLETYEVWPVTDSIN